MDFTITYLIANIFYFLTFFWINLLINTILNVYNRPARSENVITNAPSPVVKKLERPFIRLNSGSRLCPVNPIPPPVGIERVDNEYYVTPNDSVDLYLTTSLAVCHNGINMTVLNTPVDNSFSPVAQISEVGNVFTATLIESTPVSISPTRDNIGLTRRLEADQSFRLQLGTCVVVPKGSSIVIGDCVCVSDSDINCVLRRR